MGYKGGKKGKSGQYSTDQSVLERLSGEGAEIAGKVLEWRQLAKLKSTYTDALQQAINPETGRVHTSYSLVGAQTGRLSSTEPNLQNIPIRTEIGRQIREAFVAEKGNVLVSADYSQIELRILAHIADIDALKDAFKEGLDIHALTASEMFDVPIEGMDPMVRRQAKAINFGIIYGISGFGLARQLGIPQSEASEWITRSGSGSPSNTIIVAIDCMPPSGAKRWTPLRKSISAVSNASPMTATRGPWYAFEATGGADAYQILFGRITSAGDGR